MHPEQGEQQYTPALGSTILMAGAFLSYGLAAVREILIARHFGATAIADAYLIAFAIPLLISTMADYILAVPFVQTIVGYLARGETAESWKVVSAVLNIFLLIVTVVVIGGWIWAPALVELVAPGLPAPTRVLAAQLTRLFFPAMWLFLLFGVARGVLNAHRDFIAPAFGAVFNHLAVILVLILFGQSWMAYSLVVGVLLGAALQLIVQLPSLIRKQARYVPGLHLNHSGVRQLLALSSLITFGGILQRIGEFVNRAIASGLNEGTIAALNYASRIFDLPTAIYVNSILIATLPVIVAQLGGSHPQRAAITFQNCLRLLLLGIAPVAIVLVILARPVIAILFQSNVFDLRAITVTSEALMFYAPGLIAVAVIMLTGQVLYALGAARRVVGLAALGLGLNIVFNLLLVGPLQHRGLALANTLSFTCVAALNYLVLRHRLPGIAERALVGFVARLVLAIAGMILAMLWLRPIVQHDAVGESFQGHLVSISLVGGAGALTYVALLALLRVEEILALPEMLRGRIAAYAHHTSQ